MHMKRTRLLRRQTLVRTAVYSLMTLTVAVVVTLLMFVVLGYQYNERDGRLEQGGLLQFATVPTGATVTLDEKVLGTRTNNKANVEVGNHTVSFDRSGYRTWQKTIHISAGQVGWLSYARLIPSTVTPTTMRTFSSLSGAIASPDHNYLLLQENANQPVFVLVNIQGDTLDYDTLTLPSTTFTAPAAGKTQSFTFESWSENEGAIIIKHTYDDDKVEWLLLDRGSPERSVNINTAYGISPTTVMFAGKGDRLLFVQADDAVRRIDLNAQTLSRPLASKVATFTGYDDTTIAYATLPDDKSQRTVGYAAIDIDAPVTIATYPADGQSLYAAMATYFNQRYVSILHGKTLLVQSGTLPTAKTKGTLKKVTSQDIESTAVIALDMRHDNRFVVAQTATGYATYDIELDKLDKTTWAYQPTAQRPLTWLDDFMLWSDTGGQLRFYEFDGGNQQNIMPVTEGYAASVSPNDRYIYGVLKTDKGFELRRARLVLN